MAHIPKRKFLITSNNVLRLGVEVTGVGLRSKNSCIKEDRLRKTTI